MVRYLNVYDMPLPGNMSLFLNWTYMKEKGLMMKGRIMN